MGFEVIWEIFWESELRLWTISAADIFVTIINLTKMMMLYKSSLARPLALARSFATAVNAAAGE